jgi:hypothetical protein
LKEYTRKLGEMFVAANGLRDSLSAHRNDRDRRCYYQLEYELLMKRYQALRPPLKALAVHVTEAVARDGLDGLARLELELRLVELEQALLGADKLIDVRP